MFTSEQKAVIKALVGGFCQTKSSSGPSTSKLIYRISSNAVIILQTIPSLIKNQKPIEARVAKLRCQEDGTWDLFYPGKKGWKQYPPFLNPRRLDETLMEIEADPLKVFWGDFAE